MARYHINAQGNPGVCHAQHQCPFGGDDAHYSSKEQAQKAFEEQMGDRDLLKAFSKLSDDDKKNLTGILNHISDTKTEDNSRDQTKDKLDALDALQGEVNSFTTSFNNWSHKTHAPRVSRLFKQAISLEDKPTQIKIQNKLAKDLKYGAGAAKIDENYRNVVTHFSKENVHTMIASWNQAKKEDYFSHFPQHRRFDTSPKPPAPSPKSPTPSPSTYPYGRGKYGGKY